MGSATFELACDLIARPSVTPEDSGCQATIAARLAAVGFDCRAMDFGQVSNLWAIHGQEGPLFCFLGHTDVVPTGPLTDWSSPPFEPSTRDGLLYGRGSADMKGSVAAMVTALERFVARNPDHPGRIALLLTSDEEGLAQDGVKRVVPALAEAGTRIDYCLVGEPSSQNRLGDTVRIGRRGSLNGHLQVRGVQGHVAYPQLADNPIHALAPVLAELAAEVWDQGDAYFPPTSLQVTAIRGGAGASNIIPGRVEIDFNFRFSPQCSATELQRRVAAIVTRHNLNHELSWQLSGEPFYTAADSRLAAAVAQVVQAKAGIEPVLNTGGGTSDGRFVAPSGAQVVELGPVNATIHQVDEHVRLDDLDLLSTLYEGVLDEIIAKGNT